MLDEWDQAIVRKRLLPIDDKADNPVRRGEHAIYRIVHLED